MEKNLVTRLMGLASDNSLPRLGEFKIEIVVNQQVTAPFLIQASEAFTATIEGDGHFYKGTYDAQTNVTTEIIDVTTTSGYRVSQGNSVIRITPKYYLTSVILNTISTDMYNKLVINFNDLKYNDEGLGKILIKGPVNTNCYPDVELDLNIVPLHNLTQFGINGTGVHGDITNIARAISSPVTDVTQMVIGVPGVSNYSSLTGSVESFVRAISPAAYGTKARICPNGVMFNGQKASVTYIVEVTSGSGDATIKKASDSSIAATYNRRSDIFVYA